MVKNHGTQHPEDNALEIQVLMVKHKATMGFDAVKLEDGRYEVRYVTKSDAILLTESLQGVGATVESPMDD